MLTWAQIALLILRVIDRMLGENRDGTLRDEGTRAEAARVVASIASKLNIKADVMAEISLLDDNAVDRGLRQLEPSTEGHG